MAGWTNKGKMRVLESYFRNVANPTNLYLALATDAVAPDENTNTLVQLTQIALGNGYVNGGYELVPGVTDFDFIEEDDSGNRGRVQLKDIVWTASGGSIPDSGDGARYAILTDDNGTIDNREVLAYFDLTSARTVSDGQTLTVQDNELRLDES